MSDREDQERPRGREDDHRHGRGERARHDGGDGRGRGRFHNDRDNDRFDPGEDEGRHSDAGGGDVVTGTPKDDKLKGGKGADSISGLAGDDEIDAKDGDNFVDGGPGDDKIKAGKGNDTIFGGAGDDKIDAKDGNNFIDGGTGDDKIKAGKGNDTIFGGLGDDKIDAKDGDNFIDAGAGDDEIKAGKGNDTIFAGGGDDEIEVKDGQNFIDAGAGNDEIEGGKGNDTILGGAGDDEIDGDKGDDVIDGGAGNDELKGGKGSDIFVFGDGYGHDEIEDFKPGEDVIDLSGVSGVASFEDLEPLLASAAGGGDGTVIELPDGSTLTVKDVPPGQLDASSFVFTAVCFTAGTLIDTPDGPRAVEALRPGDLVTTADHGPLPLRWTGRRTLSFDDRPHRHKPVLVPAGALDGTLPRRDLVVSPLHRVLLSGWQADLLFAEPEVLVAARQLIGFAGIRQLDSARSVTYVHILFDTHEIVFAEGARTESLHPGPVALAGLTDAHRAELVEIFPELADDPSAGVHRTGPLARRELRNFEAKALLQTRQAADA